MGAAPERQPVLDGKGSTAAWTESSDVQLRQLTAAQLAGRAADLQRRMRAASEALDFETAAEMLCRLRVVQEHAAARERPGSDGDLA
jgi:hypothetical protein